MPCAQQRSQLLPIVVPREAMSPPLPSTPLSAVPSRTAGGVLGKLIMQIMVRPWAALRLSLAFSFEHGGGDRRDTVSVAETYFLQRTQI